MNKYLLNKKMIIKLMILVLNKFMFTFSKYSVSIIQNIFIEI